MTEKKSDDFGKPRDSYADDDHSDQDDPDPTRPKFWRGIWPAGGINSLQDLERWLIDRIDTVIDEGLIDGAHKPPGKLAGFLGRQAIQNATRWLDQFGPGNHPPLPRLDQLDKHEIETALAALLQYVKQSQGAASHPGSQPIDSAHGTLPAPSVESRPDDSNRLIVDRETFSVKWHGATCILKNTKAFALIERLARSPGAYLSYSQLKDDVWGGADVEDNTLHKTVSNLRQKLASAGLQDVTIDGSNTGHYGLVLS